MKLMTRWRNIAAAASLLLTAGGAATQPARAPAAIPAAVPASPTNAPAPLELELPGGVRLRLTEPAQVPLVAALLRGLASC